MRRAAFLIWAAALGTGLPASAQESALEDALKGLLDQALRINVVATVLPAGQDPVSLTRLTIPGRAVALRFEGGNIRLKANLTPYLLKDGRLMLVAQGEVWLSEPTAANAVKYLSSIKSLPVELGEKIFFYPLGIPDPVKGTNRFNLALEIQVQPLEGATGTTR